MLPISIEEFAEMTVKANQDMNKKELVKALRQALEEKNNGAKCIVCGSPIWAAGSAITGTTMRYIKILMTMMYCISYYQSAAE